MTEVGFPCYFETSSFVVGIEVLKYNTSVV
jgi:hypothetical protein